MFYNSFFLFLFFSFGFLNAQTKEEKERIISSNNVEKLKDLQFKFDADYVDRQKRIDSYLTTNLIKRRFVVDGVNKEIYDIDVNGNISYFETTNLESSTTINANRLYSDGALGINVQGQGMIVGVWDSGPVRETHVEFTNSRVNIFDFIDYSNHATHVMGTILANGTNNNARGVAFQASGKSYDWTNDYSEMTSEASLGLLVSNHSYWIGSNTGTWMFGAYDSRAQQMDQIAYAAPYYLPVVSAGNDRNSNENTIIANHNQNKSGYDLIRGMNNAKNSLTIGAVSSVLNYSNASSVQMSNFSSWGPTDDGRIKPELVAKGVSVFSSVAVSNSSYNTLNGTSMASPAVAGACLLLQQYYNSLNSSYMRSSTLKGILMHTAREAGFYDGPDYEFGWGLVDVSGATSVITDKSNGNAIVDELFLNNSSSFTRTFFVSNPSDVKVSICWTDPASGFSNNGVVDPNVSYLVNDLDLKVSKSGVDFFPWSLDKNLPYLAATNSTANNVDIFERVDINNAQGEYTITVTHKGNLNLNGQRFSLIVSGINLLLSQSDSKIDGVSIYPNPTNDLLFVNSSINNISHYRILDLQGRLVETKSINNLNDFSISLEAYNSGIYVVELQSDLGKSIHKIIKR